MTLSRMTLNRMTLSKKTFIEHCNDIMTLIIKVLFRLKDTKLKGLPFVTLLSVFLLSVEAPF